MFPGPALSFGSHVNLWNGALCEYQIKKIQKKHKSSFY